MSKSGMLWSAVALVAVAGSVSSVQASHRGRTLAVIMTNDATSNAIQVYDASTNVLLQTLSTRGQGGAGNNARGIRQYNGELFAAVNNGSSTVALFKRDGDRLKFDQLVTTTSAPVSVDFGNDHMYVAGATTVDSFVLHHDTVEWMDGSAALEAAGGGVPAVGGTSQVGVVSDRQVLVTLKADPDPGTVDVVSLSTGAVSGTVAAVPGPPGSLAPFGFSVQRDGTALITLAHSAQDGLFREGAFAAVIGSAGQLGPCWTTRVGKYVFTANTASKTLSRLVGTGTRVFVDSAVAATIVTGGNPLDLDADGGVLGVIDHGAGRSHLSLFTYNVFGELSAQGSPITIDVPDANGIAIMVPPAADQR
jgi:hypothetical protein